MKFEITVLNTALEREDRTGSNFTNSPDLKSDDATIDNVTGGTVTLNEAVLSRITISEGDPLEIFGGAAAGDYTIDTIDSDTEFTVNESIQDASEGDVSIYTFAELALPKEIAYVPSLSRKPGEKRQVMTKNESRTFVRNASRLKRDVLNKDARFIKALDNLIDQEKIEVTDITPIVEKDADDLHIRERLEAVIQNYDEISGIATFTGGTAVTVTLPFEMPNTDYVVKGLTPYVNTAVSGAPFISNKTTTDFEISTDSALTGDIEWVIELDI